MTSLSKSHRNISRVENPVENVVYFQDRLINNIDFFIGCTINTFKQRSREARDKLRRLADHLEEIDKKCDQVKQGGAMAKVAGGVVTLGGVLLAPATGGGTLVVAAAAGGAMIGAAGHAASSSASHADSQYKKELREVAEIASARVVKMIKIFHQILIEYDDVLVQAKEYLNTGDFKALTQQETHAGSWNSSGASWMDTATRNFGGMAKFVNYVKGHRGAQPNTFMLFLPTALTNIGSGVWNLADGYVTTGKYNVFAEKLREFANEIEDYTELLLTSYEKFTKMANNVEPANGTLSPHNTGQHTSAYEIISYMSCQLSNKSRETVITELQEQMELGVIQEWRESIFQVARRTCEAELGENGDQFIRARLDIGVRRGNSLAARDLGDIVELVSYISLSDGTLPKDLPSSQPVHGDNCREEIVSSALLGAEASDECSKTTRISDKIVQQNGGPSRNIIWDGINVYEMINHIMCELDIDSKETVVSNLANDIPLDALCEWRKQVFQAACRTYEASVEETACPSGNDVTGFELRHGTMSALGCADDIIELVLYTSGSRERFPMFVLCSQSSCTCKRKEMCDSRSDSVENSELYDVITNIVSRLDSEKQHDVVEDMAREMPLEILQEWREKLFQEACRTYQEEHGEIGDPAELAQKVFQMKRRILTVEDCVWDVVNLALFISRANTVFPKRN